MLKKIALTLIGFALYIAPVSSEEIVYLQDSSEIQETESSILDTPANYQATFLRMLFTLIAMILLVGVSIYFFKRITKNRMHQNSDFRRIKILEKRVLSPKSVLYLIEVNQEKVLISESHLEVRSLQGVKIQQKSLMEPNQHLK